MSADGVVEPIPLRSAMALSQRRLGSHILMSGLSGRKLAASEPSPLGSWSTLRTPLSTFRCASKVAGGGAGHGHDTLIDSCLRMPASRAAVMSCSDARVASASLWYSAGNIRRTCFTPGPMKDDAW
jgi:hypothetical protein